MQGSILWTLHVVFIGMFGIKQMACFTLFVFCLQGGYSWHNNSTAFLLVQPVPRPMLEWQLNKQAELLLSQAAQK